MKLGNLVHNVFNQNGRLRLFAFVTLVAAAVISFSSLQDLALYAGFAGKSWLLPLCVDAVAALGMEVWLSGSPAWKAGRNLAMVAILGSLAGNGGDWWFKSASFLSAGLGLVPPAALAAVLLVLHRHWRKVELAAAALAEQAQTPAPTPAPRPAQTARPAATHATPRTVTKPQPSARQDRPAPAPRTKAGDETKVAQLVEYATEHGDLPTRRDAQAYLRERNGVGVGTDKATALLALARTRLDEPVKVLPEPVQLLPEPVQLHPVPVRDESNSDSARQEAQL